MKNSFLLPLLATVICAASCSEKGTPLIGVEGIDIIPHYKAEVTVNAGSVDIVSFSRLAGVEFNGLFDLSGYKALRFTVTNPDSLETLSLVTELCNKNMKDIPWGGNKFSGDAECMNYVKPGETVTLTVPFPAPVLHPEINEQFTTMRSTPYSGSYVTYNVDLSDISAIVLHTRGNTSGFRWTVSDVELLEGEREEAPAYMKMSEAEFFPFIDRYGQFKHREWPGKIHGDEDLKKAHAEEEKDLEAHPGPEGWDKYGGWADGPQLEATGRFRVQKVDGKWWLIDPEGHLFWSHGVLRISPASAVTPLSAPGLADRRKYFEDLPAADDPDFGKFYHTFDPILGPYYTARKIDGHYDFSSANCLRKYGPDYMQKYAEMAHRRLRSWGLNTVANSSEKCICMMDRTPYCDRLEIVSKPMTTRKALWWNIPDPFDKAFRDEIDRQLKERADEIADPWCIGYFVDNEHQWGDKTHVTEIALDSDDDSAVKTELRKWLKNKYGKTVPFDKMTVEDKEEFNDVVIEKYYSTIREEFDRLAPGLLYMGCRFGGIPVNPGVIRLGARYCDVLSFNIYRYTLDSFKLPEGIDKPVMIGEFHFGALDRGLFHPGQTWTRNQDDRAYWYGEYVKSALESPMFIGTHWHQFSDQATTGRFDGEDFQVGFTDVCDTPYPETVEAIRKIGGNLYRIRYGK